MKKDIKMWVIVYGDLFEGIQGVVGAFRSEDDAEEYMESHNLGHFEKAAYQLELYVNDPLA